MADILRVTSPVINKNIIQPDSAERPIRAIRYAGNPAYHEEPVGKCTAGPAQRVPEGGWSGDAHEPFEGSGCELSTI